MAEKKHISQSTFDAVVEENVKEFGMTSEEAVEDAIKQFESQGVDLENIVKQTTACAKSDSDRPDSSQHVVIQAVADLKSLLEVNILDMHQLLAKVEVIRSECAIDIAHRCLAGSHGAYHILMQVLQKASNENELLSTLNALATLIDGQPDIIDVEGIAYMCTILGKHLENASVCTAALLMVQRSCLKHEENRQEFVNHGIIPIVMDVCTTHKGNCGTVKQVSKTIRNLIVDDDIRVPYGKAHEHAKIIVTEHMGIQTLLEAAEGMNDMSVLAEIFGTLARLAVRNEFCEAIVKEGGLRILMSALAENMNSQELVRHGLKLLKAISGNDDVKSEVVKAGGVGVVILAVNTFQSNPVVAEVGCACLAALALRVPQHCQKIIDDGGALAIATVMKFHPKVISVQRSACMAIRNLVARTRQFCPVFLELDVERLINHARKALPRIEDEAKAALRDLGCKVELTESWTGEKGSFTN